MDFTKLIGTDAALRRRQRLQPVGGQGDKLFPPTYPGERKNDPPRHVFEQRLLGNDKTWCVLVDSVQSQANRLEESLLFLVRQSVVSIPYITVDFSAEHFPGISEITSLDAPHRVYDAIVRDSMLDGQPFPETELGARLSKASATDASALLEISPTALLFGAWNSTGSGGGAGAKFARCLVSEIMAIDVPVDEPTPQSAVKTSARKAAIRIDPLGVVKGVEVYKTETGSWDLTTEAAGNNAKKVRPSEINHGNVPAQTMALGITCRYAEHMLVLSFSALRRLHFGDHEKNLAGRSLLVALGLLAVVEQDARGYALRSRCDLVCDGRSPWEVVHMDGTTEIIEIDQRMAVDLYESAYREAVRVGFNLSSTPIRLTPQRKLVEIVRQSQKLLLMENGVE